MANGAPDNFQNEFSGGYPAVSLGLPWRVLLFAVILFAFSLFVFLGLKFGYGSYMDSKDTSLDEEIEKLATQVSQDEQRDLIVFYSQLNNLKDVLGKHKFSTRVFDILEKYTIPTIYFTGANIVTESDKIELTGIARTTEDLVEQLAVFDRASEFSNSVLQQMNFTGEGVSFNILMSAKADALLKL